MIDDNNQFEESKIIYKIEANKPYTIVRIDYAGKKFYKIITNQLQLDGTFKAYPKELQFKKDVVLANGTKIIIKRGIENLRSNPKDRYHPISYIQVLDFEVVSKAQEVSEAISEFNRSSIDEDFYENNDTSADEFFAREPVDEFI